MKEFGKSESICVAFRGLGHTGNVSLWGVSHLVSPVHAWAFPGDNFLSQPIKEKAEIFRVCSCLFRIHFSKKNNHISFFI